MIQEHSEMKGYNTTDFIRQSEITSWSVQGVLKFSGIGNMSPRYSFNTCRHKLKKLVGFAFELLQVVGVCSLSNICPWLLSVI